MKTISEIQIIPVKPDRGIVAFCSFVLFESIHCNSIAIFTRPHGGFRLVYPTRKNGNIYDNVYYPINRKTGQHIEEAVLAIYENVWKNDRHDFYNNS